MIKHDLRVSGDGFHYKDQFVFLQTLLRYGLVLKEKYIRFPFMGGSCSYTQFARKTTERRELEFRQRSRSPSPQASSPLLLEQSR